MSKLSKITVIGAGSWGCALAMHLARYNEGVFIWDIDSVHLNEMQATRENVRYLPGTPLPEALHIEIDFEKAISDADLILLVVPSHVFRKVLQNLKAHIKNDCLITWATKGFDPDTKQLLNTVVVEELGERPMAVISGPSFAKEVAEEQPTVIDIASNNEGLTQIMDGVYNHANFRLQHNYNFISVQLGGAMKNIIAIAVGIADGLGYGSNTSSALMTTGLKDIKRLVVKMGSQGEALINFSGVGDLILTCSDNKSRNRRFGLALGQGKSAEQALTEIAQVVEGLDNTKLALALAEQHGVTLNIASKLDMILEGKLQAKQAVTQMLELGD